MNNRVLVPEQLNEELANDKVHIWCSDEHRKHFINRRGILRTILGYYLGVEPSRLQFCYGKNEKSVLADMFGNGYVHFNLSHSKGLALYAFSRHHEIGVDFEHIRDIPEMEQIARRFFSAGENAVFHALPKSKKKEVFFSFWTRKEAVLKATGDGLSRPLDRFDVSLAPGEPARLLRIDGGSKTIPQWLVQDLKPAPGFAAAFAVEAKVSMSNMDNRFVNLPVVNSQDLIHSLNIDFPEGIEKTKGEICVASQAY
jgi:4'-phosphopantetheinyl transferase